MCRLAVAGVVAVMLAAPSVHAQGVPGFDPNKCLAGKNKCVSKKIKGLMKCREKCQKKPDKCGAVQAACEQKVMDKFDGGTNPAKGCFAKLEAKEDLAKPESVCTTTGDTASMEAEIDAEVASLVARLEGTPAPTCGDGVVNAFGEECDGGDLAGEDCTTVGFDSGSLGCTGGCAFDTSGCATNTCGDGAVNVVGEECDGGDLAGATCTTLGFESGSLGCTGGCIYDTSGCVAAACGDGVVNAVGEHCDGADLGGQSCLSLGHVFGGTLACDGSCDFDVSGCLPCCSSVGGVEVGGACWFLGALSLDSCDTTCANVGLVCDSATVSYAGTGGTLANCDAVIEAIQGPTTTTDSGGAAGIGCVVNFVGDGVRATAVATTCAATPVGTVQRVCACS